MEYLVTMTTHVPDGTSEEAVADVRGREAADTREAPWLTGQITPLVSHPEGPAVSGSRPAKAQARRS